MEGECKHDDVVSGGVTGARPSVLVPRAGLRCENSASERRISLARSGSMSVVNVRALGEADGAGAEMRVMQGA